MKAIIIEDEAPAARKLIKLLHQCKEEIEILDTLDSVAESIEWFERNEKPDIIFSDIQLADSLSFDIFSNHEIDLPIIFTTAYDEYAIQAFKHHSIDYLLKPIKLEDINQALEKYESMSLISQKPGFNSLIKEIIPKSYKDRFLVSSGKKYMSIQINEIAYFYSEDGVSFIKTNSGEKFITNDTLETIENQISPKIFFRVNRQFLININSIESFEPYFNQKLIIKVLPKTDHQVLVSKLKAKYFKEWMGI